jgi:hypothetical protein
MHIPVSITFEYPTLEKIGGWLRERTAGAAARPAPDSPLATAASGDARNIIDDIDALLNEQDD